MMSMMDIRMTISSRIVVCVTVATLLIVGCCAGHAHAISPEAQFHEAKKAYNTLRKRPGHQKYRDKWLVCIEKYQQVYRLDPDGPWAAAGLYHAGLLYIELHKRSYLGADRQAAVDAFQKVIQQFPKSRYTPRSKTQLKAMGEKPAPARPSVAAGHLKKAHAAYERLMGDVQRQKYRDQWHGCIVLFQNAYQSEPRGPHAAEALYMTGRLYQGLYENSRRSADREKANDYFGRVQREFPASAFAGKAAAQAKGRPAPLATPDLPDDDDDDPLAGIIAAGARDDTAESPVDAAAGGMVTVEGLRFWSNPSYTRIVVDADQETRFTHRLLKKDPSIKKPQRLYIDLSNSRLGRDLKKFVPINDELLSDARAGQYTPESVRIVVDIKSFKNYKIFSLKNPFRIVLDVWGQDSDRQVAQPSTAPATPSTGKLPPGAIARQLALGVSRIVIDPGHGGKDYGAPGYRKGVHEKHVVLEIAKRLAGKVERELKCDVILTRTTDRYLTLEERTAIANTQNADLFVSIHTNAVRDKRAYGIETFFLNLATDDDAIRVAARENATSAKNISDLESILNDLMQNAKINESSRLAAMVQTEMCLHLKNSYSHIRSKGVKQAPFYVLLGAQMPAILVETAFISNPRECDRLTSAKYQEAVCNGIIRGIRKYIRDTNPTAFNRPEAWADRKG